MSCMLNELHGEHMEHIQSCDYAAYFCYQISLKCTCNIFVLEQCHTQAKTMNVT